MTPPLPFGLTHLLNMTTNSSQIFTGLTSKQQYRISKIISQGGQGVVALARSPEGQQVALKWYHASMATDAQRSIIDRLCQMGPPRALPPTICFLWPLEVVVLSEAPVSATSRFGYVMAFVDLSAFATINDLRDKRVDRPSLRMLCRLSARLVEAVEHLHASGLVYGDINHNNLMFDTSTAEVVIFDNDNVRPNKLELSIQGTPNYMAPEIGLGTHRPSSESDLYSLAVLLYYLWIWEHPLEGKRTYQVSCWDNPAIYKFFYQEPVFQFHPTDLSNSARGSEDFATATARWDKLCPEPLKAAFLRSFTEGTTKPGARVRLTEWRKLFRRLELSYHNCLSCNQSNYVDTATRGFTCLFCGRVNHVPSWIEWSAHLTKDEIPASVGTRLSRGTFNGTPEPEGSERPALAIEAHPKVAGAHLARNLTQTSARYRTPTGVDLEIPPGKAAALVPDATLLLDGIEITYRYHPQA